ncbi:3-hydroxyacyl-CoA dehydrogenase NAD-binding protein [Segniliparus rotundus DSM 44985]|uniref:3-hydroxyacyl-CoA dehydrogenase NAD-binding protein n=1 Tax=Segniliparus rotundus (strain ATCC BAA-972 / CDC 1076 / CIP 108378 / DSM 44985 / JCM 13578) TaxID=640132 RepID=D6ZBK8_SEGRD|nr:3-hydroxyacyl-CoA dehydrogenase family protein [Segniliparus rotundus]ADG98960.1 3-hydroxyacyl-CoA dehydrogenase NAD-binding protein [Segniliparus rotundus DSM 44985]
MERNIPTRISQRPMTVIGGGTLGRAIAFAHAVKGTRVRIYDPDKATRESAAAFIAERRQSLSASQDSSFGEVSTTSELDEALREAWFVVEAVPERRDLKIDVLGDLDEEAEPDAIIGTNSTTLPSRMLIEKVRNPERLLNIHYYRPPECPAVDLMSCGRTHRSVIDFLLKILPRYGLRPFETKADSSAFIPVRLWTAVKREAMSILAEGLATPAEIDEMTYAAGYAPRGKGIFRRMDRNGLDVALDIENQALERDPSLPTAARDVLRRYVKAGKLGKKSGEGFYKY